eukprot:4897497-Pyramimonas_sp.AAC.1
MTHAKRARRGRRRRIASEQPTLGSALARHTCGVDVELRLNLTSFGRSLAILVRMRRRRRI